MKYKLYGDGVHDDTKAIQEMIDGGACEVSLPVPEKFYLISAPLELPSNFRLVLPRFAEIRLADNSNCVMLKNKMVRCNARRLSSEAYEKPIQAHLWGYIDDFAPDAPCRNIEVCGGIWNCNNQGQLPNPERMKEFPVREFYGCGMLFYNVTNFTIRALTVKDPSQYGIAMDTVSYFRVEDITFDYNDGNPYPINMDGVHLDGHCHYGVIRNLQGTCYDDLVALNAHEGSRGDITDIQIDGIFAHYCHSAVRLLLVGQQVRNISISNVYGNYYQYCVGISKFYPGENTGKYDGITIERIYASKAMPARKGDFQHPPSVDYAFPLIWVQEDTRVGSLSIKELHRREKTLPKDTIYIGENSQIDWLVIDNITTENETGEPMPLLHNKGIIKNLSMKQVCANGDEVLVNEGEILGSDHEI